MNIKNTINNFLEWLKVKPAQKKQEAAWPFPVEFTLEQPKTKRKLPIKKATTRVKKEAKPVTKKIVKNTEKIVKKKAK